MASPFRATLDRFTRPGEKRARIACSDVRLPVPLAAEIAAARVAGRLSRLVGTGGGTTVPGKLLWKLDPGAVDRLAARLPLGVNGDDPQVGDLARERPGAVTFGVDDPRRAHPSLQHAADSKYCVRCGTPYEYAAPYVGHLGDYRCPSCGHGRPALTVRARQIELEGLDSVSFRLELP